MHNSIMVALIKFWIFIAFFSVCGLCEAAVTRRTSEDVQFFMVGHQKPDVVTTVLFMVIVR